MAKHIEGQLQTSRALRSKEAEVLSRGTAGDGASTGPLIGKQEDEDSAKMRCLRADLRLLQGFRMSHFNSVSGTGKSSHTTNTTTTSSMASDKEFTSLLETMETEGKQQRELADKSLKAEKSGKKEVQTAMVVQLFEARRELMGKISEDLLKDKTPQDLDVEQLLGVGAGKATSTTTTTSTTGTSSNQDKEKDTLASWDAQLYLRLVQTLLDQEKELKEQYQQTTTLSASSLHASSYGAASHVHQAHGPRDHEPSMARDTGDDPAHGQAVVLPTGSSSTTTSSRVSGNNTTTTNAPGAVVVSLDEVTFALQKLRRDHLDLKQAHTKMALANAQLEDELAQLQRKYDHEKRAYVNETKWYVPKIQKLEDTVVTTSKAFDALKLNVELLTNMYKTLRETLHSHALEESELKRERDQMASFLSDEIKKVALLTKENTRKDKLVQIAMSARHEMAACASRAENKMQKLETQKKEVELRAKEQADECAVAKLQLDGAYSRLGATDDALRSAKQTMERLQQEMEVVVEASRVKEGELKIAFEKDLQTLQQKFDKTKRELMDAMSQNLSLDGRLRKMQEKVTKLSGNGNGNGATEPAKTT